MDNFDNFFTDDFNDNIHFEQEEKDNFKRVMDWYKPNTSRKRGSGLPREWREMLNRIVEFESNGYVYNQTVVENLKYYTSLLRGKKKITSEDLKKIVKTFTDDFLAENFIKRKPNQFEIFYDNWSVYRTEIDFAIGDVLEKIDEWVQDMLPVGDTDESTWKFKEQLYNYEKRGYLPYLVGDSDAVVILLTAARAKFYPHDIEYAIYDLVNVFNSR